jgi:hypothetical protein
MTQLERQTEGMKQKPNERGALEVNERLDRSKGHQRQEGHRGVALKFGHDSRSQDPTYRARGLIMRYEVGRSSTHRANMHDALHHIGEDIRRAPNLHHGGQHKAYYMYM